MTDHGKDCFFWFYYYVQSRSSPEKFYERLVEEEMIFHSGLDNKEEEKDDDEMTVGRAYRLILADITSGSMLYISKTSSDEPHVNKEPVAFGVHSLSLEGLDSISPKVIYSNSYARYSICDCF